MQKAAVSIQVFISSNIKLYPAIKWDNHIYIDTHVHQVLKETSAKHRENTNTHTHSYNGIQHVHICKNRCEYSNVTCIQTSALQIRTQTHTFINRFIHLRINEFLTSRADPGFSTRTRRRSSEKKKGKESRTENKTRMTLKKYKCW